MTIATALRQAALALAPVSDTPRLDAELLMTEALGVSRSELLVRPLAAPVPPGFAPLLARRLRHEPIAYIRGRQAFHGLELIVTPDVLIPRGDSETLIEAAQATLAAPPARVLDLGTGSGALLLAALALWPESRGIGTDRSLAALAVAAANAAMLGLAAPTSFLRLDWNEPGWSAHLGTFDLILVNPPYVETAAELDPQVRGFEPAAALFAGADGLDAYRVLVPQLPALLASGALALVEIGATQAPPVTALANGAGLDARLHHDLGGRPRALALKKSLGNRPDRHYFGTKPADG